MKNRYSKKRYKLQAGIQRIEMDTPDYSKAYEIQAEQTAKNKGISQAAQQFSGAYAPIGQVGGMAGDVIRNRAKNKKTGATVGGAVEMGASGAALGAQLGGPWGAAAGLVVGGTYGALKGAADYKKIKAAAQAEERRVEEANFNKTVREGASTDAQSFLAKKGKYKIKTKEPRLIETEGREPIFSPKKPDGTRDLLYYNPNDPTHEEGGVKAVVMPKAEYGKKDLTYKSKGLPEIIVRARKKPVKDETLVSREDALDLLTSKSFSNIPLFKKDTLPLEMLRNMLLKNKAQNGKKETLPYVKPLPGVYEMEEARRMSRNKVASKRETKIPLINESLVVGRSGKNRGYALQPMFNKETDTYGEDLAEIFDPTGVTSYDDLARSWEEYQKNPDDFSNKFSLAVDAMSSIPVAGRLAAPFKLTRGLLSKVKKARQVADIGEKVFTPTIGTLNKAKKYAGKASKVADEFGDYMVGIDVIGKATKKDDNKVYGAKQLKTQTLNDTRFSSSLNNNPTPNAANKFVQPLTGIQQVARQIPEDRRQEKINTPRSHKKSTGPVKTVDPPMLYEMKPPPPRSTFNTKNDFNKGSKKVKVYR